MPLINCPECQERISDRADNCPHCGLPARFFATPAAVSGDGEPSLSIPAKVNLAELRNALIAFDHSCQTFFSQEHYITAQELDSLQSSFGTWAESLRDKAAYEYCREHAPRFAVDFSMLNACLRRFESLRQDAERHNTAYIDRIAQREAAYFDNLLRDIDPAIRLDAEQRRAVVTDDDYC